MGIGGGHDASRTFHHLEIESIEIVDEVGLIVVEDVLPHSDGVSVEVGGRVAPCGVHLCEVFVRDL